MMYLEKPSNFNSKFEIVSCFFECDDKFLLLLRQDTKPQGNTWGVPAGKVEVRENSVDAIVRELFEETGFTALKSNILFIQTVFVRYSEYDFLYHIYKLHLNRNPLVKIDSNSHKDFKWVSPTEALGMNLIPDLDSCIEFCYRKTL